MDVGWMVGESGIKANSAQFSWSLAELGKNVFYKMFIIFINKSKTSFENRK